ncbi:hypothetical protein [Pleurocapsa sp. PCC 7319]|uniref:hypothetical protein n=1 Tax=Pleurocapsa sp. PCC 7319 TaxID=118161 RepID=UPI00035F8C3D|nr:hypothetical protein [Pleurocapsa sp. PCC 7319]
MTKTIIVKPLELVLQKAGLVSSEQVQIALQDRAFLPKSRIGEIMVRRRWITQQTTEISIRHWSDKIKIGQGPDSQSHLSQYF